MSEHLRREHLGQVLGEMEGPELLPSVQGLPLSK